MNRPLTAVEGVNHTPELNNASISITRNESRAMHRRDYEKLMSKDKQDLVRIIMGDNAYFDAISQMSTHFF